MSKTLAGVLGLTTIVSLLAARWRRRAVDKSVDTIPDDLAGLQIGDIVTDGVILGTYDGYGVDCGIRYVNLIRSMGPGTQPRRVTRYIDGHEEGHYGLWIRRATAEEIAGACIHGALAPASDCPGCNPLHITRTWREFTNLPDPDGDTL